MSSDSFAGRTAIVTGAASGIGREIARQTARHGAHVLVTDLAGTGFEAVAEEIRAAGGSATEMAVDVSSREDLEAAVAHVVDTHGRLDYMFNNAGVAIFGEVEILTLDDWDKIIDVNLRGVAYGTTIAYSQMVKQGGGHIVSTASAAALVAVPFQAHYCATKHGVLGMHKAMSLEGVKHGIHSTVFCPAFVDSGMFENNTLRGTMEGVDTRNLVPIKPLATDKAVERLLRGVAARREIVVTPFYARLGWWLERFSPALSHRLHMLTLAQTAKRAKKARAA